MHLDVRLQLEEEIGRIKLLLLIDNGLNPGIVPLGQLNLEIWSFT